MFCTFTDICCLPSTLSVITNWPCLESIFLPKYPLSNSCGQLEQSYQDYVCPEGYEFMQCDVDPNMEQKASTQANCKLEGSFLCFFFSFILIYIHFHSSLPFQGTVHHNHFFVDLNQSIPSQDIGIMGTCVINHGKIPLSSVRIILDKRVARP